MAEAAANAQVLPRKLNGSDKVAALLLAMGKPSANRVLKHFDEHEIKLIARSAAELGAVGKPLLDEIIDEFAQGVAAGAELMGNAGEAEQLLSGVIPEDQIAEILSDMRGQTNLAVWPRLSDVSEAAISQFLQKEHPQVGAFVMARARPGFAAAVLSHLPSNLRNELMRRMLSVKAIMEVPLRTLEGTLHDELILKAARNKGPNIHARMADIINKMERKHMDEVLASLNQTRPREAKLVKGLLFTFDDIAKLTDDARLKLLDRVPPEKVILALRGADPHLVDLILSASPSRARRMIEQELQSTTPVPPKEISKARRAIADLALEMAEGGVIEIQAQQEEEEET